MNHEDQEYVEVLDEDGFEVARIYAYDAHGSGRSNKLWAGDLANGEHVEAPNLKELRKKLKTKSLKVGAHV